MTPMNPNSSDGHLEASSRKAKARNWDVAHFAKGALPGRSQAHGIDAKHGINAEGPHPSDPPCFTRAGRHLRYGKAVGTPQHVEAP